MNFSSRKMEWIACQTWWSRMKKICYLLRTTVGLLWRTRDPNIFEFALLFGKTFAWILKIWQLCPSSGLFQGLLLPSYNLRYYLLIYGLLFQACLRHSFRPCNLPRRPTTLQTPSTSFRSSSSSSQTRSSQTGPRKTRAEIYEAKNRALLMYSSAVVRFLRLSLNLGLQLYDRS